jgi:hypothetical protein
MRETSQSSKSENRDKEDILESRLSVGGEALSMSDRMIYGAHCIRWKVTLWYSMNPTSDDK